MATNEYDIGDSVRMKATFKSLDTGLVADPTVITFKLKVPDGTVSTKVYGVDGEIVKDSTGVYHWDFTTLAKGKHHWRVTGTGAVIAAGEGLFTVVKSNVI